MKIIIGSDHQGFTLKNELIVKLKEIGYDVFDKGTYSEDSSDYPIYAYEVGRTIQQGFAQIGILICKTGIGMSIAANKMRGIRCAKVDNLNDALLAKKHNDANVISLSINHTMDDIMTIVNTFLNNSFDESERNIRRLSEIDKIENGDFDEL